MWIGQDGGQVVEGMLEPTVVDTTIGTDEPERLDERLELGWHFYSDSQAPPPPIGPTSWATTLGESDSTFRGVRRRRLAPGIEAV